MSKLQLSKDSGIYLITCTANGKIYIGSAVNLHARWRSHKGDLRASRHGNRHLQYAWLKYGEDAFSITVLEKCELGLLIEREQYYLDLWQPFGVRGFNIALNASAPMLGRKASLEHRAKMSIANKGKKQSAEHTEKSAAARRGQKRSEETKAKLRDAWKTRPPTKPETRAKISDALRKRPPVKLSDERKEKLRASHLGKVASAETRAKMSASQKKRVRPPYGDNLSATQRSKNHYLFTAPDGTTHESNCLTEFCEGHGLLKGNMSAVLNGRRSQHRGWTVKRIENGET